MVPLAATAVPFTDAVLLATALAVAVAVMLLAKMVVTAGLVWVTGGSDSGSAIARERRREENRDQLTGDGSRARLADLLLDDARNGCIPRNASQ